MSLYDLFAMQYGDHYYEQILASALWDAGLLDKTSGRAKTLEQVVRVMLKIDELLTKEPV